MIQSESAWLEATRDGDLHEQTCGEFDLQAQVDGITFTDCVFSNMAFQSDAIAECTFIDCEFIEVSFSSVKVTECQFKNCRFYQTETEVGCTFRFANLVDCLFERCDLSMANFSRSNLYRTVLNHCQAQGADFSHTTIESGIGGRISLHEFTASESNLAYCDWTGADLQEASISNCRMVHAVLNEVNLEGAILNDNELHGVTADGLRLRGADLRGSGLDGLDVREIDMTGVTIDEGQQRALLEALGILVI